jgi:hypothetical protein
MPRCASTACLLLLTLSLALPVAAQRPPGGKPPNIVFIMSDDHAAHAISA